jgi:hypothetical protein
MMVSGNLGETSAESLLPDVGISVAALGIGMNEHGLSIAQNQLDETIFPNVTTPSHAMGMRSVVVSQSFHIQMTFSVASVFFLTLVIRGVALRQCCKYN